MLFGTFANPALGNGHLSSPQRQGRKPPGQGGRLSRRFGPSVQNHKSLDSPVFEARKIKEVGKICGLYGWMVLAI